jgi:hypothetical protein
MLHYRNQKKTIYEKERGIQNPMLRKKRKCKKRERDIKFLAQTTSVFSPSEMYKRDAAER